MQSPEFDPVRLRASLIPTEVSSLPETLIKEYRGLGPGAQGLFSDLLVGLHNQGEISLLAKPFLNAIQSLPHYEFWSFTRFLNEIIPNLDGKADEVIRLVGALVERGGTDLAASWPIGSLREWFIRNSDQALDVAALAEAGKTPYSKYAHVALRGTGDRSRVFKAMDSENIDFGAEALFAISFFEKLSQKDCRRVINKCLEVLKSSEDHKFRSMAIEVAFKTWKACPGIKAYKQRLLLSVVFESAPGVDVLKLAPMLFSHEEAVDPAHLPFFFDGLAGATEHRLRILEEIDGMLCRSLDWDFPLLVQVFERHLPELDEAPKGDAFHGFTNLIWAGESGENRSYIFARWFSNGHPALCSFLARRIPTSGNMDRVIEIHKKHLPISVADQVRLAARTVGYCFMVPQAAASILFSVVRNGKREAREEAERLLWDPLAVGYSGPFREYLKWAAKSKSKRVLECAKRILKRQDTYLEGLRNAAALKEHQPSGWQYALVTRAKYQDLFSCVYNEAQQSSIFAQLIRNVYMVHGTRCLNLGHQGKIETPEIMEVDKQFSVSTEFPKQQSIAPIGIELMLYSLRFGEPRNSSEGEG